MLEGYFEELKGRVVSRDWRGEAIISCLAFATFALYFIGLYINQNKLNKWIKFQTDSLKENQFALVGFGDGKLYIQDDDQHFTSYASGRINIAKFVMNITLEARQNITMWLMENVFSFFFTTLDPSADEVTINVELHKDIEIDPFIFAICNKDNMDKYRNDNYFLSLTRTVDSNKIPSDYVFMSESPELNDLFINEEFTNLLKKSNNLLKYIAFTDQPEAHPFALSETQSKFRAILKINLQSDKKSLEVTKELIDKFISIIDFICSSKFKLRTELLKKIKKVRDQEHTKLEKLIEKDKKEQLEEKKLEELKKQKEELKNKNPKEYERMEKKLKDKQQRKLLKKQRQRA